MEQNEKRPTKLLHATDELRQLISDNPGLPLLVFAGEEANDGEHYYTSCSHVCAYLGEFLNCQQNVDDSLCYIDRDDFREDIEYKMSDFEGTDEEYNECIDNIMREYAPYWEPCIILYVNN